MDPSFRERAQEKFAAGAERRKQEPDHRDAETRERHEILERIQADVAAGRKPNPADVTAIMNYGVPKPGSASPDVPPREKAGAQSPSGPQPSGSNQFSSPAAPPVAPNPVRKWTDRTGKFAVNARLLKQDSERVVLEKEDGKTVEVPIAKLSEADVKLLREIDENPFYEPPR